MQHFPKEQHFPESKVSNHTKLKQSCLEMLCATCSVHLERAKSVVGIRRIFCQHNI